MGMVKPLPICIFLLLPGCGAASNVCPTINDEALGHCISACEGGNAVVCARVGVAFESGAVGATGGEPDVEAAERYFVRACEQGNEEQRSLCIMHYTVGVPNEEDARELLRLCNEGELLACHELVRTRRVAQSIPMDLPVTQSPLPARVDPPGLVAEPTDAPGTEVRPTARTTSVSIGADGSLYLDAEPTTLEAIRSMTGGEQMRVVITADGRTPYAQVVGVIDALRQAGVTRYAINVRPRP